MATTTELTKQERDDKERDKLRSQLKGLNDRQKKVAEKLTNELAWMAVTLEDIRAKIDERGTDGHISEYKNGENQWGTKESPEIMIYHETIANYMKGIKQLTDLVAGEKEETEPDADVAAIMDFIAKK